MIAPSPGNLTEFFFDQGGGSCTSAFRRQLLPVELFVNREVCGQWRAALAEIVRAEQLLEKQDRALVVEFVTRAVLDGWSEKTPWSRAVVTITMAVVSRAMRCPWSSELQNELGVAGDHLALTREVLADFRRWACKNVIGPLAFLEVSRAVELHAGLLETVRDEEDPELGPYFRWLSGIEEPVKLDGDPVLRFAVSSLKRPDEHTAELRPVAPQSLRESWRRIVGGDFSRWNKRGVLRVALISLGAALVLTGVVLHVRHRDQVHAYEAQMIDRVYQEIGLPQEAR